MNFDSLHKFCCRFFKDRDTFSNVMNKNLKLPCWLRYYTFVSSDLQPKRTWIKYLFSYKLPWTDSECNHLSHHNYSFTTPLFNFNLSRYLCHTKLTPLTTRVLEQSTNHSSSPKGTSFALSPSLISPTPNNQISSLPPACKKRTSPLHPRDLTIIPAPLTPTAC